ncbi:lipocalin family protein [Corallococcus exercitus]|uniref:Lipocalin family protein n=1 Tax=Corallococcus exercitus TaxID=2316736 RepID=A0A7Y4JT63_9BACT|nr:lipocalin family protein [Corallococcus exercitus]NOK10700.1 lipocalin family protein [Corallococcus exercitus]
MARPKSPFVWILLAVGGACAFCCTGTLGLMALGLFAGDSDTPGTPAAANRAHGGSPGEPGGFAFDAPQGWKTQQDGRFIVEWNDGGNTLGAEALRLPAVPGLDDAEGKLARLWQERIGADWNDVKPNPLVMRRFVANGARAFFTAAVVRAKNNGRTFRVSLYLVEAGDRLEPLVFIQSFMSPPGSAGEDMSASFSWNTSSVRVEEALKGVRGSPVGLPLVDDAEVVGHFIYGTSTGAQWVNTYTGSTTMTAVSYSIDYTFGANHAFQYKYAGASGQVGAMRFGSEDDQGTWSVKHDVLTLTGAKRTRRYLLIGAARSPEGKRTLYLMSEHPGWSLAPGAIGQNGELYVAAD